MTTKMLDAIFKNVDSKLLTEDVKKEVETLLTEAIDVKVDAKIQELKESYDAKTVELTESFAKKEQEIKEKAAADERVLIEEAEKHKKELEQAVIEETKSYKERTEKELAEEATKYREEVESMVLQEAKELKARQDAALVEEVKKFREEMIDKVSDYIEAQLSESIPTELMEAAAKLEVYQPLVESIQNAFSANYIKLDGTSYKLIKEARDEIQNLKGEIQNKAKEEIKLKKQLKNVERNIKIENLTEGLTAKQKGRAVKLLEGVELESLDAKFGQIRDVLIESDKPAEVPSEKKVEKLDESKKTPEPVKDEIEAEIVKHQVKKVLSETQVKEVINESKTPTQPEGSNRNMSSWKNRLNRQITRN